MKDNEEMVNKTGDDNVYNLSKINVGKMFSIPTFHAQQTIILSEAIINLRIKFIL